MNILELDKQIKKFAENTPSKVAIEFGDKKITYGELDQKSNKIADFLMDNYKEEKNVFVIMDKGSQLIEVLVGIIKSGGIFAPVDYKAPDNRIISMITEIKTEWSSQ